MRWKLQLGLPILVCCMIYTLSQAVGLQGGSRPTIRSGGVRGWRQAPRLGEADLPGPLSGFDNECMEAWSEDEDDWQHLPGGAGELRGELYINTHATITMCVLCGECVMNVGGCLIHF